MYTTRQDIYLDGSFGYEQLFITNVHKLLILHLANNLVTELFYTIFNV